MDDQGFEYAGEEGRLRIYRALLSEPEVLREDEGAYRCFRELQRGDERRVRIGRRHRLVRRLALRERHRRVVTIRVRVVARRPHYDHRAV